MNSHLANFLSVLGFVVAYTATWLMFWLKREGDLLIAMLATALTMAGSAACAVVIYGLWMATA